MNSATYARLRSGEWGIRVQGAARKGQTVRVCKKSGETKIETIASVVWAGNGVTLCAVAQSTASTGSYHTIGSRMESRRASGWTGCSCGSIEGNPRDSDCRQCSHDND